MCSEPEDLRQRAGWDGASGNSRRKLLANLHRESNTRQSLKILLIHPMLFHIGYISSAVMIPPRRFSTLLSQARSYQLQRCVYHNSPSSTETFSLYTDHQCDKAAFPRITTLILEGHTDEVWNIEWSHDGNYLASASKDKTAIIWKIEVSFLILTTA